MKEIKGLVLAPSLLVSKAQLIANISVLLFPSFCEPTPPIENRFCRITMFFLCVLLRLPTFLYVLPAVSDDLSAILETVFKQESNHPSSPKQLVISEIQPIIVKKAEEIMIIRHPEKEIDING